MPEPFSAGTRSSTTRTACTPYCQLPLQSNDQCKSSLHPLHISLQPPHTSHHTHHTYYCSPAPPHHNTPGAALHNHRTAQPPHRTLITITSTYTITALWGIPPPPSGFHALLGSSPSPPQGRPGELPLFLLVAVAPVASPSLVPLPPHIYEVFAALWVFFA